jgi:hypothetical protein
MSRERRGVTRPLSDHALRGRVGAFERWSRTEDRTAATEPARRAFMRRFEVQVDPKGVLEPTERGRRAYFAMRAYMAALSRRRVQTRRTRKAAQVAMADQLVELAAAEGRHGDA